MSAPAILWHAISNTGRLSTVAQILIFLPLTLAVLSKSAFLWLSLLLFIHSIIHGTLLLVWGSTALSLLQVPMHPFMLLVCFNAFENAGAVHPYILTASETWGTLIRWSTPLFITMEGLSSLLVAQSLGAHAKKLIGEGEGYSQEAYQFGLLISSAVAYVGAALWIAASYPAAASSPLSSTLLGVSLTAFLFLTLIGFGLRRTNIIESSALALVIAFNVSLCGYDSIAYSNPASSYSPLWPNILPHLRTMATFITNTLPKPVLFALVYRLTVLHLASRILPTIGDDSWDGAEGVDEGWGEERPTSTLTRILLTYRQSIFVVVYSHLLMLDPSSQTWWRWMNVGFTLAIWAVELLVSNEDDTGTKGDWKID